MKKVFGLILVLSLVLSVLSGCTEKKAENTPAGEKNLKVVIIGNQKFGDNGPMDDMAAGGEKAAKEFGVEFKKIESKAASFEDDVRAMSQEGYDLVITTFPYMSEATKTVAQEFPDTKYAAVFQSINKPEDAIANIWDTEFRGQTTLYINGYIAGLTTKTNKVGILVGGEEPSPNAEANGFMRGVHDANPKATVEFAYASYEDTAKVKEIAVAMIKKGVDIIQGDCGAADSGIVEAANEAGNVLVMSVISDFTSISKNFAGSIKMGFGEVVYESIKGLVEGNFPGGTTGIRDITNKGYYLDFPIYEAFAERNSDYGPSYSKAIEKGKEIEKQIINGDLKVEFDTTVPSWKRIAAE